MAVLRIFINSINRQRVPWFYLLFLISATCTPQVQLWRPKGSNKKKDPSMVKCHVSTDRKHTPLVPTMES